MPKLIIMPKQMNHLLMSDGKLKWNHRNLAYTFDLSNKTSYEAKPKAVHPDALRIAVAIHNVDFNIGNAHEI